MVKLLEAFCNNIKGVVHSNCDKKVKVRFELLTIGLVKVKYFFSYRFFLSFCKQCLMFAVETASSKETFLLTSQLVNIDSLHVSTENALVKNILLKRRIKCLTVKMHLNNILKTNTKALVVLLRVY